MEPASLYAELWILLLREQLEVCRASLPSGVKAKIRFISTRDGIALGSLGACVLDGADSGFVATSEGADCTVLVDEVRVKSFFKSDDVEPGTFFALGDARAFDVLLDAVASAPKKMSWLEARALKR